MKMTDKLLWFSFLFLPFILPAQSTFQTFFRDGIGFTEGINIIQTEDGGFVTTGATVGNNNLDLYIIKTDADGNEVWSVVQDYDEGVYADLAIDVKELSDAYMVLGYTWKLGTPNIAPFTIKLDKETGEIGSYKSLPFENDWFYSLSLNSKGNYISFGYVAIPANEFSSYALPTLIEIDTAGNVLWEQSYESSIVGGRFDFYYGGLHCDADGSIYLAAGGSNTDSLMVFLGSDADILTVHKTDAEGNELWHKRVLDVTAATSLARTSDGIVVSADRNQKTNERGLLFKYDPMGNLIWQKSYGAYMTTMEACVANTADELFCFGSKSGNLVLLKLDAEGTPIWSKTIQKFSPITAYRSRSMVLTQDGGIAATGAIEMDGVIGPAGIFVLRLNRDGEFGDIVNRTEVVWPRFEVSVFPNPTSDVLHIEREASDSEAWSVRLLDTSGKLHYEGQMPDATHTLDMQSLPAGSYFLELRNGRGQVYQKMVVRCE